MGHQLMATNVAPRPNQLLERTAGAAAQER